MPFTLTDPLYQEFELERTDKNYDNKGDATIVVIRQARQHEHARRQDQWNKFERRYSVVNPDEMSIIQELSFEAIKMMEAQMTLVDSNIIGPDGEKPLFKSKKGKDGHPVLDMTPKDFEVAWGSLPMDVAQEIHEKILEVNPMWASAAGE